MSLPEQLQKQVDDAKKIVEEHYGQPNETKDEKSEAPNAETSAPPPPAAETVDRKAVDDENSQTYAQRWRSLQGVYNSQHAQLQAAAQRIASLEGVITAMQVTPSASAESKTEQQYLTAKDREEYGDEMIDFTTRAAKQENARLATELAQTRSQLQTLAQQFQQLQGQVVPTVQRVAQTQQQGQQQGFLNALAARLPNWEAVNASREFHRWLLSPDPMTGITRQTYLADAEKTYDVHKVLSIFNAYLSVTGTPSAAARKTPGSELERQVAPGRTLAAPAPASNDARKWARTDISKLYDDKRRGVYRGREAEFRALEEDIFAAQKEGRIAA